MNRRQLGQAPCARPSRLRVTHRESYPRRLLQGRIVVAPDGRRFTHRSESPRGSRPRRVPAAHFRLSGRREGRAHLRAKDHLPRHTAGGELRRPPPRDRHDGCRRPARAAPPGGHLGPGRPQEQCRGNGGRTWKLSTVPGISKCTGGGSDEVVDPWVSIGRKGVAYFASLPLSVSGFLVNRSRDGGLRWSAPTTTDPAAGQTDDLPSVVATPRGSRRAYLTWSRFTFSAGAMTGGDVRFSRSIDGARTFSTPVVIHSSRSGEAVLESRLGLLADGSLLDVFGEAPVQPVAAPMEIFASRSVNGGRGWTRPVRIATVPQDAIVDPETGKSQYNFCCLFGAATGRHGAAYLGYTKVAGTRSGRVVVVRSKNRGRSSGRPRTAARAGAQVLDLPWRWPRTAPLGSPGTTSGTTDRETVPSPPTTGSRTRATGGRGGAGATWPARSICEPPDGREGHSASIRASPAFGTASRPPSSRRDHKPSAAPRTSSSRG